MPDKISQLIDFVSFTHEVRNVKRSMWNIGTKQFENDSEHSFQLAIVALYVIDQNSLKLDAHKAMAMALVHDIVEVYSGDTCVYGGDTKTQKMREADAISKLKQKWPKQKVIFDSIDEYEHRESDEAKFVYALDKLLPIINNYLDNGRSWKLNEVTLVRLMGVKAGKVDINPEVNKYYKLLLELLSTKPELFYKTKT
jgi:putative hydrolase of HD superfamily